MLASDFPAPSPPGALRGLVTVLFLGTLVAAFDIALVGPTLRAIGEAFGRTDRATSWVLTAFVLTNLAGQPFTSWLGDRYARRTIFLACLGVFALGTAVVATAPVFEVLLAGRVVQGLGASGLFPMASAVVGDVFPPQRRGRVLGALGAVFGVAFLVGPVLAGILVQLSWRWVFVTTIPLAAGVFAAAWRVLPRTRTTRRSPLDGAGIVLLMGGLLTLALGVNLIRGGAVAAWLSPALLTAAGVLFAGFAWHERRTAAPILRPALLAKRQVRVAALFAIGAGLCEALFVFLPAYTQEALGVDRSAASYLLLPLVFSLTLGAPLAGRLLDALGSRRVLMGGAVLLGLGLSTLAFPAPTRAPYLAGTVLIGLGLSGMLGSSLSYILLNEAAAHERAVAQSLVTLFLGTGQILGAALLGALIASGAGVEGFRLAFRVVLGAAAVLVVASFALQPRHLETRAAS